MSVQPNNSSNKTLLIAWDHAAFIKPTAFIILSYNFVLHKITQRLNKKLIRTEN